MSRPRPQLLEELFRNSAVDGCEIYVRGRLLSRSSAVRLYVPTRSLPILKPFTETAQTSASPRVGRITSEPPGGARAPGRAAGRGPRPWGKRHPGGAGPPAPLPWDFPGPPPSLPDGPADAGAVPVAQPFAPALLLSSQPRHEQRYRYRHHPAAPQLPGGRPRSARRWRPGRGGVWAGHRYLPVVCSGCVGGLKLRWGAGPVAGSCLLVI